MAKSPDQHKQGFPMMSTWQKYLITAVAAFGFAANAMAQYIWLDEKGTKQFSDTPPPASVPKNRIIKEPGRSSTSSATAPSEFSAKSKTCSRKCRKSLADPTLVRMPCAKRAVFVNARGRRLLPKTRSSWPKPPKHSAARLTCSKGSCRRPSYRVTRA